MTLNQMQVFSDAPWYLGAYQSKGVWCVVVEEARGTELAFDTYCDLLEWAEGEV